jgi:hypothetical protein
MWNLVHSKHLVEDAVGLDNHNRALRTKALTTRRHNLNLIGQLLFPDLLQKSIADFERAVGDTTCPRTYQ